MEKLWSYACDYLDVHDLWCYVSAHYHCYCYGYTAIIILTYCYTATAIATLLQLYCYTATAILLAYGYDLGVPAGAVCTWQPLVDN